MPKAYKSNKLEAILTKNENLRFLEDLKYFKEVVVNQINLGFEVKIILTEIEDKEVVFIF